MFILITQAGYMIYTSKELKYIEHHMKNAINAGTMSCSEKRKVGCVIVKNNRVIINGWNGRLPNQPNCCEELVLGCSCGNIIRQDVTSRADINIMGRDTECVGCGCLNKWVLKNRDDVVHAEENALLYAAKEGISVNNATLYTTTAPCVKCSRMIIGSGITTVYYMFSYKNTDGIKLLKNNLVTINKLYPVSPEGFRLTPSTIFESFMCRISG